MQLYIVDYPRKSEYAEAAITPVNYDYDRCEYCPECGARVSGAYWMPPREVVLTRHKAPDFLYGYSDNVDFVVSDRVIEAIRSAELTGLLVSEEIETVRFQRKPKQEKYLPKYYHIEVARSRITIDHDRSNIKYGSPYGNRKDSGGCPLCRPVPRTYDFMRSLTFHMEKYEGYDIFQSYELCNTLFVSQRFVDTAGKWGLTNLHYTPVQTHGEWAWKYFLEGDENA